MKKNKKGHFVGFHQVHTDYNSVGNQRTMVMTGCDGTNHAVWIATEFLDEDGSVYDAEDHGTKITCKCTGSCKNKRFVGGFIHHEKRKLSL